MIPEAVHARLNAQITNELNASQVYLAASFHLETLSLKALAAHFRKQADEERGHALKLADFILETGGKVTLGAIAPVSPDYPSVPAVIDAAAAHERKVTQQIYEIANIADQHKDLATRSFIQWFIDEQVEEVASMDHLTQIAKLAGPNLLQLEAYVRAMGRE